MTGRWITALALTLMAAILSAPLSGAGEDSRRVAVRRVARSAAEGDPEALYQLSRLHENGYDSIPRDSVEAFRLLELSAKAGSMKGANLLGFKLLNSGDTVAGLQWIERAAEAGDPKAQSNLGYLLLEKDSAGVNAPRAAYWLQRGAESGIPEAQSMLGDLFRYGHGVERDSILAEAHYRSAFEHGLTDAAYKLADMLKNRYDTISPAEKLSEALYFYQRSAPDIAVGMLHQISEDSCTYTCAVSCVDSCANSCADSCVDSCGSVAVRGQALALLGDAYTRARGVSYDYDGSMKYYLEAALLRNPSACFIIGELLEIFPDALAEILPEAFAALRESIPDASTPLSCRENTSSCKENTSLCKENTNPYQRDVANPDPQTRDYESAVYWLEQAARAGIRDAAEANRRLKNPPAKN